jgi:hypothetical protein
MTRTEERLADALAARAESVYPASVRPLPAGPHFRERRARRRYVWLAPVAAAISVAVIAAVIGIVAYRVPRDHHDHTVKMPATLPGGPPAPLPPYFIGIHPDPGNDLFNDLAVYDAGTGAVVTDLASRTRSLTFTAVAATAGRTEFLAAAEPASDGRIGCGATLYEVKLTTAGRLASLLALPGAPHPGYVSGLEVSADGRTVAVESGPCYVQGQGSWPDRVELLRLAGGRARRWTPGGPTVIPSLGSLPSDGRSLAFSNAVGGGTSRGANDGAARIVRASAKNGPLTAAARVVVAGSRSAPYGVESVALSPDGAVLYACARRPATAPGYHYSVVLAAYHAASGGLIRVLGSWNSDQFPCQLAMAPSGDYALVIGIFSAPAPYAYRVNLSTGQAKPVGRALIPGRPPGDKDPYTIAW